MGILKFFKNLFDVSSERPALPKPKPRRKVEDVKPGEYITIESGKVVGGIGHPLCINNDPLTRKILIEFTWNNIKEGDNFPKKQQFILDYNDYELRNFHLLNEKHSNQEPEVEQHDIATLQKKLNEALEKEEFEKADKLQKQIDKLSKKT